MKASVTTITLVQIPYLDLIKIRPIFEDALIWYNINPPTDNQDVNNMAIWIQRVSELQCTMEYCQSKEEVFGCVDQSIRTTLIIEGDEGLNFLKLLFSGISFNYSIIGIVIFDKRDGENDAGNPECEKMLELVSKWRENISLPILKKFSIELATNTADLKLAVKKLIDESRGIKLEFADKRQ